MKFFFVIVLSVNLYDNCINHNFGIEHHPESFLSLHTHTNSSLFTTFPPTTNEQEISLF